MRLGDARVNPVILIASCALHRRNGFQTAVRETWMARCPIPCYFVLGVGSSEPEIDELVFKVDDSHSGTPYKLRAACRWAKDHGHDYSFHCCTDTYVIPSRLLASGFGHDDVVGHMIFNPKEYPQGGAGFWLGPEPSGILAEDSPLPEERWSDLWAGNALRRGGISDFRHDPRYWPCDAPHFSWYPRCTGPKAAESADVIAVHLSRATGDYQAEWMRNLHRALA